VEENSNVVRYSATADHNAEGILIETTIDKSDNACINEFFTFKYMNIFLCTSDFHMGLQMDIENNIIDCTAQHIMNTDGHSFGQNKTADLY
jgi:hypothetical protein